MMTDVHGLSMATLSTWLCAFQAVFRAHGHAHMLVGGSSARALLDGRLDSLRDVDLFLVGEDRDAGPELTRMAADLAKAGAIRPEPARPREKRRADPDLPLPARDRHAIGFGLHVFPREAPLSIVSLTVLARRRDLALNGIFDIDAVYLVLDTQRPLAAQMAAPVVHDPFAGHAAWQARRPRVIHWEEVARCHARHGLRIARTLAACGRHEPDAALVDEYQARRPAVLTCLADESDAAASERDRDRGMQAGFYRYLAKPVQVDELVTALESLLVTA